MPNTNCLEDIKCPVCLQSDTFDIVGKAQFEVTDDGAGDHGDVVWDDNSPCTCPCGHHGCVDDFRAKPHGFKPFSVLLLYPEWMTDGKLETYFEHANCPDAASAVRGVQVAAAAVNNMAGKECKPEDFTLLMVFAGHCEAEGTTLKWTENDHD